MEEEYSLETINLSILDFKKLHIQLTHSIANYKSIHIGF